MIDKIKTFSKIDKIDKKVQKKELYKVDVNLIGLQYLYLIDLGSIKLANRKSNPHQKNPKLIIKW